MTRANKIASGQSLNDTHGFRAAGDTLPITKDSRARNGVEKGAGGHAHVDTHSIYAAGASIPLSTATRAATRVAKIASGQARHDTHVALAAGDTTPIAGQESDGTQPRAAGIGESQASLCVAPKSDLPDLSALYSLLKELNFRREIFMKQEMALRNRVESVIRRNLGWSLALPEAARAETNNRAIALRDRVETVTAFNALTDEQRATKKKPPAPFTAEEFEAAENLIPMILEFHHMRQIAERGRAKFEIEMAKAIAAHPVWTGWALGVVGFGPKSFATILANTGDLSNYATVSTVWKRMGVAVIDGGRQRKMSNKEDALKHGYNPQRRSDLWNLADPLIKAQMTSEKTAEKNHTSPGATGPYGAVYAREKARAMPRIAATAHLLPTLLQKIHPDKWTKLRVHNHACRLMTKALLQDMWRVSRGQVPHYEIPADASATEIAA